MFTGIITDIGRVARVERPADMRLDLSTAYDTADIEIGASVMVNGACLTVVEAAPGRLSFDISNETSSVTTLGRLHPGDPVNLERSLKVGDELGGHIVTGHVDGIGHLVQRRADAGSQRLTIAMPETVAPYVATKGSIAVDGVSLTVNEVGSGGDGPYFTVNIIPHTQTHTTLGALDPGCPVNLEIDILARYVARLRESLR
ncbi:MAG: riboflavin synthase [Rhodothalassiaceae bacterium]